MIEDPAEIMPRSAVTMDAKMVSVLEESVEGIRWFPIETLIGLEYCSIFMRNGFIILYILLLFCIMTSQ